MKKPQLLAIQIVEVLFCGSTGIRTLDPILKRDVLYLLSYAPAFLKRTAKLQKFFEKTKFLMFFLQKN